jgi:hypothetical protein
MTTLTSDIAKSMTETFFEDAIKKSSEWLSKQMESILTRIEKRAKSGHYDLRYDVDLDNDDLRFPKEKALLEELNKLKYKVTRSTQESRSREYSIFTISWE